MIGYFARLSVPKLVLWCYLAWYVAIVACYFDPSPLLWLSSAGIASLIGIGLVFATRVPGQGMERWVVCRLFMFPFCVSSYSALIKGKGFILLFPTEKGPLLVGVAACAGMVAWRFLCRAMVRGKGI